MARRWDECFSKKKKIDAAAERGRGERRITATTATRAGGVVDGASQPSQLLRCAVCVPLLPFSMPPFELLVSSSPASSTVLRLFPICKSPRNEPDDAYIAACSHRLSPSYFTSLHRHRFFPVLPPPQLLLALLGLNQDADHQDQGGPGLQPLPPQDREGARQDPREGRVRDRRHRVRREEQQGDREGALRRRQARRQALLQGLQDHQGDRDRRAPAAPAAGAGAGARASEERGARAAATGARRRGAAAAARGRGAGATGARAAGAGARMRARAAEEGGARAPAARAGGEAPSSGADQGRGGAVPVALPLPVSGVAVRLLLPPRPRRLPLLLLQGRARPGARAPAAAVQHLPSVPAVPAVPSVPAAVVPVRRLQDRLRGGPQLRLLRHVIW